MTNNINNISIGTVHPLYGSNGTDFTTIDSSTGNINIKICGRFYPLTTIINNNDLIRLAAYNYEKSVEPDTHTCISDYITRRNTIPSHRYNELCEDIVYLITYLQYASQEDIVDLLSTPDILLPCDIVNVIPDCIFTPDEKKYWEDVLKLGLKLDSKRTIKKVLGELI